MNTPSNPPSGSLHHCDKSGVPDPYDTHRDWEINPGGDDLSYRFARVAIERVLYAVTHVQHELFGQSSEIARDNLPANQWDDFQRRAVLSCDLGVASQDMAIEVAAKVVNNIPAKRGTLERMLSVAMDDAGFCCEAAVDQFVADHIGRFDLEILAALPGFGVESVTLAGGRKLSDERRMSGGPRPVDPQEAEAGFAAELLVANMAQDRPTFFGVVLELPPDFPKDRLPPILSLDELQTRAFLGSFLDYHSEDT